MYTDVKIYIYIYMYIYIYIYIHIYAPQASLAQASLAASSDNLGGVYAAVSKDKSKSPKERVDRSVYHIISSYSILYCIILHCIILH